MTLVLQLVEWVAERPRTYAETLEAWRTSCPRLTVWEDACDGGLVEVAPGGALPARVVRVTADGAAALAAARGTAA
ncbi:MAG TPA: hypothetical protein VG939_16655 [Caulobacteraceae bacterium]|nr:hypothetical protein [Caulobacteraceae bacterium]